MNSRAVCAINSMATAVFLSKSVGVNVVSCCNTRPAPGVLYDTKGHLRLSSRYGSGAKALAGDIQILLNEAR